MPHYDLQISAKRATMEIREITFFFCVILGIDWQAINHFNEMYVLYMFYMHFKLIVSVLCCQSVIPK